MPAPRDVPIFKSLEIIEKRITERLSVECIAQSVFYSKFHYQRLFREIVGESVMAYVSRRKMELAADALLTSGDSILEIALRFGFETHEGFTRSFKARKGVSPAEYRRLGGSPFNISKERITMTHTGTTDEIIGALNGLIEKIKETAARTRKEKNLAETFYVDFWEYVAERADELTETMEASLSRINKIAKHPDEITARFAIIKAMEDAAFSSNILAFNAGLMINRASPEHIEIFNPLLEKYYLLAFESQRTVRKIAALFGELSKIIFGDMRETAGKKISAAVDACNAAALALIKYPYYAYIKDELDGIARIISEIPQSEITAKRLDDCLFSLDIVIFAAETDIFRMPAHKPVFEGVYEFKKRLADAEEFHRSLSEDFNRAETQCGEVSGDGYNLKKVFEDMAFQGNILFFVTKGETQKMGTFLNDEGRAAFEKIFAQFSGAIERIKIADDKTDLKNITASLKEIHGEMIKQADALGPHGACIRYIAKEFEHFCVKAEEVAK